MIFALDYKALSVNKAWQGRRKKTEDYRIFERDLMRLLPNIPPLKGLIEIRFRFHMKNHKRSDWDNPIKLLQDVLVKKGIIEDDSKIYIGMGQKVPSDRDFIEVMIVQYSERNIFEI